MNSFDICPPVASSLGPDGHLSEECNTKMGAATLEVIDRLLAPSAEEVALPLPQGGSLSEPAIAPSAR